MSYGYDSSYRGMSAPAPPGSNYNTLYDSANETANSVAPGRRSGSDGAGSGKGGASPSKHKRLASLDVVRGFTIALMIFVDELGEAYPVRSRTLSLSLYLSTCL